MPTPGEPSPYERAKQVFLRVIDAEEGDREGVLRRECAGDDGLRRQVEALLSRDGAGATVTEVGSAQPLGPERADEFDRIGRYRILSRLGEGGFGLVYLAQQDEPVQRRVALKVIKPGMDSARVVARFEAERQALALMDHPYIAKVLDAGTTSPEQGSRPFFVMELVAGEPITEYCDRHSLSIRDRLRLFERVCEAIQHAHTKGVIHRDIKPSNVLVSVRENEEATPKVIDFGVAKALHQPLVEGGAFTEQGQLIGTPEYMSPEQAEMGALDVDTRTDVYALGVLLYELLAGSRPFELRNVPIGRVAQTIRASDTPRPGTRLADLGDGGSRVADRRRTTIAELSTELGRELEWIPLKAIRKDRTERYQTVAALGADVRRYLDGLPLEAGPESGWYQFRKFVGRHRGGVAAVGAVAATLVLGITLTSLATWWALAEQKAARALAAQEEEAASRATEAQVAAEASARRARDSVRFLTQLLLASGPASRGADTRVVDVLDQSARLLDADERSPLAARLDRRVLLARGYLAIGFKEKAREQALLVQRSIQEGAGPTETSDAWMWVVLAATAATEAESLANLDRAVDRFTGEGATAEQATALAARARVLTALGRHIEAEDSLARAVGIDLREPVRPPETGALMVEHAAALATLGRVGEARDRIEEALALDSGEATRDGLASGAVYRRAGDLLAARLGRPDRAADLYQRAIEALAPALPEGHPEMGRLHLLRGAALYRAGDKDGAHAEFDTWTALDHGPDDGPTEETFIRALLVRADELASNELHAKARDTVLRAVRVARALLERSPLADARGLLVESLRRLAVENEMLGRSDVADRLRAEAAQIESAASEGGGASPG